MEQFYACAIGKIREHLGLNYNAYGIITFTNKEDADEELKGLLNHSSGLEGVVVDITPLVQQKFIPKEKLYIVD